jgi:hypothetical protein
MSPAVPLKFLRPNGGGMTAQTLGLVDSGASCSMLPISWADQLGIDPSDDCDVVDTDTAGGRCDAFSYSPGVEALILGHRVLLQVTFQPKLPVVLLGRIDFFHEFKVAFDQRSETFKLDQYPDLATAG